MFNPIKALHTEISAYRTVVREFITAYEYEQQIEASKAKLAETKLVTGYTKIYA